MGQQAQQLDEMELSPAEREAAAIEMARKMWGLVGELRCAYDGFRNRFVVSRVR